MTIRASRLPLVLACPASQVASNLPVEPDNSAARLGTAVHEVLARSLGGEWSDFPAVATRYRVDSTELARLYYLGRQSWRALREYFPTPEVEVDMRAELPCGTDLVGHADVLDATDLEEVRIADWKSGWAEGNHDDQMRGYAYLALQRHPEHKRAYTVVVRIPTGQADAARYERAELDDWASGVSERLKDKEVYSPGEHCRYCPRSLTCPARTAAIRQAFVVLTGITADDRQAGVIDERDAMVLYDAVKQVEVVIDWAMEAVRDAVDQCGGLLELPDGRQMRLVEQQRRTIDPRKGMPVLRHYLPEDGILGAASISRSRIEAEIRARLSRPEAIQAIKDLGVELEAQEAYHVTTYNRMEVSRNGSSSSKRSGNHVATPASQASPQLAVGPDR